MGAGRLGWTRCFGSLAVGMFIAGTMVGGASAATAPALSAGDWFPLRGEHIIGCTYLSCDGNTYHSYWALDLKGTIGEPVYAAGAGTVVNVVSDQGNNCDARTRALSSCTSKDHELGNNVTIDHGGGNFTYYTHLKTVAVAVRDASGNPVKVDQNTQIGTLGISGWTYPTFPHVHFERRSSAAGPKIDPGKLKGCSNGALKVYPNDLSPAPAPTTWQGMTTEKFKAVSDGTSCGSAGGGSTGGRPKVDLVFVIDTTGSMGSYISAAKDAAATITSNLFAKADARVALVDYKDYFLCSSDGYAARVDLPFSSDPSAFASALAPLAADGGCDTPESVYSGLMAGIRLPWRNGATKALLVMGDAPPHDPEPVTGFTRASVSAAAFAVDPASIYSINISGGGSPYFEDMAADSGGKAYVATNPTSAVLQIGEAITTITESAFAANAGGPYSGVIGNSLTVSASQSSIPAGASIAAYEWDFNNDGVYDVSSPSPLATFTPASASDGSIGLRITTDSSPPQSSVSTARMTIYQPTSLKFTGQRAGKSGTVVHLQSFLYDWQGRGLPRVAVTMAIGAATCVAQTENNGRAVCDVTLPPRGPDTVSATTTMSYPYFGAGTSEKFNIN